MKVGFLPLYRIQYPSSRYRVFQFLPALEQLGYQCSLIEAPQRDLWKRLAYVPRLLSIAMTQDVLYVQKRIFPQIVLEAVRRLNSRIIFDLDDAIYLRTTRRPKVDAMLRIASLVVAGNEHLASYARRLNERVLTIPSVVDTDLYRPPSGERHPGDDRTVIGWIGSDPNRGDLAPIKPVLDWLGDRYGDRVVVRTIGRRPLEMQVGSHLEFVKWTLESSRAELTKFDIGIMPLEDTDWNRGKCGFKLIQYLAVGTPAVASPVGVNREIVQDGETGFWATSIAEWKSGLARLVGDESLCLRMGHLGRERIVQHYSVKAVLPLLTDALQRAAAADRGKG